jgi:CubicO group peptidase (beta-lactamase class C family)
MPGAGYPGRALREAVSWPHHRVGDDWVPVDRLADNAAGYPSGFLLASIEDMTQFALHMIHGTLLSGGPLALATTRSPRWTEHASSALARASSHYGLGVFTGKWSGQTVLRHGGSQLTSNCSIDFFPGSDSAIVLLTNGADDDTFVRLLDLCYRAVAGSPGESPLMAPVAAEPASIGGLTGTFLNVDTGAHVVIETGHGGSTLVHDGVRMPLRFLGDDRWLGDRPGGPLPVGIPKSAGRTEHVVVWGGLHQRIDAEDRGWEPERLVGVYADSFWDEPDTRLTVEIEDDSITVSGGGHVSSGRWLGRGLISDHGLIELDPDGSSLTLGRATRYRRVG